MSDYNLTHLKQLEAESIHIIREVAAEFKNPVLLYSIGKDSAVLLQLALKAFAPGKLPFPLMHIDTTWKFQDMYRFRDDYVKKELGLELLVYTNKEGLKHHIMPWEDSEKHTELMKTDALKAALDLHGFDAAFGGARRDEEKSRAKERVFSFRDRTHRWDPKNQRPEPWKIYNTQINKGESVRVFPLSNWTELDIWMYIHRQNIDVVPLYYSAQRLSWIDDDSGIILAMDDDRMMSYLSDTEKTSLAKRQIRFRTLGCYPQTGAVESPATASEDIVLEMMAATTSEREGRMLDKDQSASMEKKKREGYF